jgi:UDP-galactopyranose mutase
VISSSSWVPGFFGATIAHRVAADLKLPVPVLERRDQIGGKRLFESARRMGMEIHEWLFHVDEGRVLPHYSWGLS